MIWGSFCWGVGEISMMLCHQTMSWGGLWFCFIAWWFEQRFWLILHPVEWWWNMFDGFYWLTVVDHWGETPRCLAPAVFAGWAAIRDDFWCRISSIAQVLIEVSETVIGSREPSSICAWRSKLKLTQLRWFPIQKILGENPVASLRSAELSPPSWHQGRKECVKISSWNLLEVADHHGNFTWPFLLAHLVRWFTCSQGWFSIANC